MRVGETGSTPHSCTATKAPHNMALIGPHNSHSTAAVYRGGLVQQHERINASKGLSWTWTVPTQWLSSVAENEYCL